ncbi:snRNA-activating protein of 50kDa MW C terminal-domain-containing protein [Coprinopsis sp. MPI-PUGE-AT-0042]|nr:snRNA-activating protein of 50kDa MW C terminal-domain-containing protein [Coprinopsis sp. MPI-PUGE-AT-0042]
MARSGVTQTLESLIGPPSELISVSAFLTGGTPIPPAIAAARSAWRSLLPDERALAEASCSVTDIKLELETTWDDPSLAIYLAGQHDSSVNTLFSANLKAKRASKKAALSEAEVLPEEVVQLQKELERVQLKSWRTDPAASLFVRPPRNQDWNTLYHPTPSNQRISLTESEEGSEAILTLSIYNKVPWGPSYVTRVCQQVYVSSQNLSNVYDALPCVFKAESQVEASGGTLDGVKRGCAIGIEGVVYGTDASLAQQVVSHSRARNPSADTSLTAGQVPLHQVRLASLSIRLHKPYTILHRGNCEHFIVFEQIRLRHPTDPLSGYPQLLQVTPPLPALCRACKKVPAVWSIAGDVRLGESPCLLCKPCWENMGVPSDTADRSEVNAVALPFLPSTV